MFPSSRLGSHRLRNRDPFMGTDDLRDIFDDDETSPVGFYRSRPRTMGSTSRNHFEDFPRSAFRERFSGTDSPFNMEGDDFIRKTREGSPFFSSRNSTDTPPPEYQSEESFRGRPSSFFNHNRSAGDFGRHNEARGHMSPRSFSRRFFPYESDDETPSEGRQPKVHHIPIHVEQREEKSQPNQSERAKSPEKQHGSAYQQFSSNQGDQQGSSAAHQYSRTPSGNLYQQSKQQRPTSSQYLWGEGEDKSAVQRVPKRTLPPDIAPLAEARSDSRQMGR